MAQIHKLGICLVSVDPRRDNEDEQHGKVLYSFHSDFNVVPILVQDSSTSEEKEENA